MSSDQPPQKNDGHQVPSWDEFNMLAHEEDPGAEANDDDSELDDEEVNEPAQPEEFGPSLPPGIGGEDSQGDSQPTGNDLLLNDFSIPIVNYDLDDPEDPLQGSSSSTGPRHEIGPQIPSSMLPRIGPSRTDEHLLPSIGNSGPSADFIPGDQSSGSGLNVLAERIIGPALPPDLMPSSSSTSNNHQRPFPNMDELDDIGPAMPPDEPQSSSSFSHAERNQQTKQHRRSQERAPHIGPTLPSSSDEDEEEEEEENDEERPSEDPEPEEGHGLEVLHHRNGEALDEERADELIGPMPPAPDRSEAEEEAEYLARLAEFEANKKAKTSNGLQREEWMTVPPQKMVKSGAFAPKTSFSRSNADTSSSSSSAWTTVPNANGGQKSTVDGPSTSAPKPPKRSERDEWEEERANELNRDRNESLLDIHHKKRKMDPANAPSGSLLHTNSGERRPFNRDSDMEVRGLGGSTDANALKERMGDLTSRFGHSKEKKFL